MAFNSLSGSVSAQFNIKVSDDNYNTPTANVQQPANQPYGFGTTTGNADLAFSSEFIIAPSTTQTLTLDDGSLTLMGNSNVFVNVKAIRVHHAIDSASTDIDLAGDYMTTNFGASFSINLPPNGIFIIGDNTVGYAVVATTGDVIELINNDAVNSAVVSIDLLGTSV